MDDTCFLPEQTTTVDFINTIDFIARHIQPSAFTLILDLSYDEEHLYVFSGIDNPSKTLRMKLALYRCIIELVTPWLRGLGLKDFFVHISWPIETNYNHFRDLYESLLEQMAVGRGYDSFARGKKPTSYKGLLA
ncbi:uncharacterized protein ASPGLDRAFT_36661 [Aspergillus glaucus CBS 516.65]|uniref:Uncharacterized protein n=1 Tax=Aspergillus glaucus CBS 516.65 TaxID=1160497 RepID=A0A1L9VGZ3_ASPGL|nr:hypothetical protein ASPGLDRAFT_36661 [Aspergillus glaucus CBS 516.65]OJJ83211.1 hypothetical protein ASPGLDRAFT_36661 [Aspergillus glaucus CBS 516.65]